MCSHKGHSIILAESAHGTRLVYARGRGTGRGDVNRSGRVQLADQHTGCHAARPWPPWRDVTSLQPGDVLSYCIVTGTCLLFVCYRPFS